MPERRSRWNAAKVFEDFESFEFRDIGGAFGPLTMTDPSHKVARKSQNFTGGIRMRKVEQIEKQIRELSSEEFAELREWVLAQDWAAWDAQIEHDASSGKLESLVSEAKEEYESGKTRKL